MSLPSVNPSNKWRITSTWEFSRTHPLIGPHISTISGQGQDIQSDYILYRTFATHSNSSSLLQLYVLVHPHLEYACAMLRETLNLLEGVQKFGLRVCFKQYWSSHEANLPVLKSWTFLKLYKTHGPSLNSHYHHNVHTCVCSYNSTFF